MILTNKHRLPEEIVSALTRNRYVADDAEQNEVTDYSVTSIIAPIQQTVLKRRLVEERQEDIIDRFYMLYGNLAHSLLEEHGSDDSITEKRFYKKVLGKTLSGQIDHYKDGKITDYKTVGAYKVKKGDFDEWAKQLNAYSLLVEEAGYPVQAIRIIAIIRDWSEANLAREKNYPEAPIVVIPILKWSHEARTAYIEGRVRLLIENEAKADGDLLPCTDAERWSEVKDWSYQKTGAKRATKVYDNEEEANACEMAEGYEMVKRMTPPRRCQSYCGVSHICRQYQKEIFASQGE